MDWRYKKYYTVTFSPFSQNMRVQYLKLIDGIKFRSYKEIPKQADEMEERGSYQFLISVPYDGADSLEFELRKAERNDDWCEWKEIKQDTTKKYFDVLGFEMPYRKCDMNPAKRCNRCMNC